MNDRQASMPPKFTGLDQIPLEPLMILFLVFALALAVLARTPVLARAEGVDDTLRLHQTGCCRSCADSAVVAAMLREGRTSVLISRSESDAVLALAERSERARISRWVTVERTVLACAALSAAAFLLVFLARAKAAARQAELDQQADAFREITALLRAATEKREGTAKETGELCTLLMNEIRRTPGHPLFDRKEWLS